YYSVVYTVDIFLFFFSSRRRHTRFSRDWSSDVCSSDLVGNVGLAGHRTTYGAPFNRIHELQPGDRVVIETAAAYSVYVVDSHTRSEERRVGKECRSRWSQDS